MKIALVGNQNSGKTTLFNTLTGMNAKIGNWPGVTIEKKVGIIKNTDYELVDLPGIYSLSPYSIEEEVSKRFILEEKPDVIINIIDSTSLERSLYLTTQLLELDCKIIVALNMVDILEKKGFIINEKELERSLQTKVLKISALKGTGIDRLIIEIGEPNKKRNLSFYDVQTEQKIKQKESELQIPNKRFVAIKQLEEDSEFEEIIATERYDFIENIKKNVIIKNVSKSQENMSDKLDKIFLNKWFAFPIFVGIMFCVYYLSVGVVGRFTVDFISQAIQYLSQNVRGLLENLNVSEWLNSLIVDGIIAGVGSVLGFIPQLIILFTCISVLETTGYMSRIALLLDKIFRKIGLSGKSLIPFIIGSGCSVPGIMGTRIIENSNEREMTAILTPFIPCSAKLPVIAMFSGYFFDKYSGLVSASLYFLAITIIILSAMVMKKWIYKNNNSTYISELPEYKLPSAKYVFKDVFDKTISFIKRAGSVILMCSIIIWFLLSFSFKFEYGVNVENSILSWIGRAISWIFYPMLGVNSWGATVSTIQGLVAKEQVISSMTVIAGLSEEASGQIFKTGIFSFFTSASAYAFMVFNLFSAPCFGAIGALEKELGTFEKMLKVVIFQIVFAWSLAVLIYQVGSRIENGSFNIWNFIILVIIGLIFFMLITSKQKCSQCEGCGKCIDMK